MMAQWVKALAIKTDDLLNPKKSHDREIRSPRYPLISIHTPLAYVYTDTHMYTQAQRERWRERKLVNGKINIVKIS